EVTAGALYQAELFAVVAEISDSRSEAAAARSGDGDSVRRMYSRYAASRRFNAAHIAVTLAVSAAGPWKWEAARRSAVPRRSRSFDAALTSGSGLTSPSVQRDNRTTASRDSTSPSTALRKTW